MEQRRTMRRWSQSEEDRLIRQVKFGCQNMHNCFTIVAEEIDRTPGAVANHWYTKTSKDPEVLCFFTASSHHIAKNRKNGAGEPSNYNVWRRLVRAIQSLVS